MQEMILLFNFLIPTLFFFLGRSMKGNLRREIMKESIFVFLIALIFTPVVHIFLPLSVQMIFCAFLMLLESIGVCRICYR